MSNPNLIRPPEFVSPQEPRTARLAVRAAGLLLDEGMKASPDKVKHTLAVKVGGYEIKPASSIGNTAEVYVHRSAKPEITSAATDETTKQATQLKYKSGSDFNDSLGVGLNSAARSTADRLRATGLKAKTLRGRAARGLVKHAIKHQ